MTRRELRTHLAVMTFLYDFHGIEEREEQFRLYVDYAGIKEEEVEDFHKKLMDIEEKRAEIDSIIDEISTGWKRNRILKTDLMLLRVAIFEMKFDDSVPEKVAINEAVELAKLYGGDKSPSFINGVLAKLVSEKES